jgi:hypothetical protein
VRVAWQRRHASDYIFDFPTAIGWSLLTLGIYGYYILYQLVRRSRDHNHRRRELLDAATSFAWEHARARGMSEELRPHFQNISDRMRALSDLESEFRDPVLWVVLSVVTGGLAGYVAWVLLDGDLVKHEAAERDVEAELATIYRSLGRPISAPDPTPPKGAHNVVGRLVATVASCGIYSLWWLRDLMIEGNAHFVRNWRFEDELARAAQSLLAA